MADAEAPVSGDLMGTLGVDWLVMALQLLAFIVLLFILKKFIYPPILAMLDRHDQAIEDSLKAAKAAQDKAEQSDLAVQQKLAEANTQADEIIAAAKQESLDIVRDAQLEAERKAENIAKASRVELDNQIAAARQALRAETLDLVALATEKIIDEKVKSSDEKIIKAVIKDAING